MRQFELSGLDDFILIDSQVDSLCLG